MPLPDHPTAEHRRLSDSAARRADWKNWGPYLAERAWGTVREDYSADGDAWNHFPHDHARSRAYRWNEDGLAGFCNRFQNLCLSLALWNEHDPFLKERLFGLANEEGNHGEDVKEYYYYLDGVPSHAFMRMLYKYPQVEYPYAPAVRGKPAAGPARARVRADRRPRRGAWPRGVISTSSSTTPRPTRTTSSAGSRRYNRGPEPAPLHILPQLWFRNTWSWGYGTERPVLEAVEVRRRSAATHRHLGERWWYLDVDPHVPALLFTENETNFERLFGVPNAGPYVKDAFHEAIVGGRVGQGQPAPAGHEGGGALPAGRSRPGGSSGGANPLQPGRRSRIRSATSTRSSSGGWPRPTSSTAPSSRRDSTTTGGGFSARRMPGCSGPSSSTTTAWSSGSTATRPARSRRPSRRQGRNAGWQHVYNLDVLSVPDKWEYPWFAAWDTAFHCIVLARLDPEWAKRQIVLLLREWYMHPSGQLPAYEWDFSDANPPVHAHAALRVYEIDREMTGASDTRVPRGGLPQAAAQLHLVGQPQGPRGPQRVPGGLPRPGQHRRLRPQPAQPARRPPARAGRRHRLDGDVLPRHAGDRARAVADPAGLRGDRHQVLRALRGHLARDQRVRRRDRHVGPGGSVSTTT